MSPSPTTQLTIEEVNAGIAERCVGLNYVSETDSPLTVFQLNRNVDPLTPASFRTALKIPPFTPIEYRNWEDFFDAQVALHPDQNWTALRLFIEAEVPLTQIVLFRVGTTAPTYYLIGLYDSVVIGATFQAVET